MLPASGTKKSADVAPAWHAMTLAVQRSQTAKERRRQGHWLAKGVHSMAWLRHGRHGRAPQYCHGMAWQGIMCVPWNGWMPHCMCAMHAAWHGVAWQEALGQVWPMPCREDAMGWHGMGLHSVKHQTGMRLDGMTWHGMHEASLAWHGQTWHVCKTLMQSM